MCYRRETERRVRNLLFDLVPKDYCAFLTNRVEVNLSTVNDFCKAVSNFPTVEDRLKKSQELKTQIQ